VLVDGDEAYAARLDAIGAEESEILLEPISGRMTPPGGVRGGARGAEPGLGCGFTRSSMDLVRSGSPRDPTRKRTQTSRSPCSTRPAVATRWAWPVRDHRKLLVVTTCLTGG